MDWKKLIADLKVAGLTQQQIAAACEVRQGTISLLATGTTKVPRDSLGQALRQLAAQHPVPSAPAIARVDPLFSAVAGAGQVATAPMPPAPRPIDPAPAPHHAAPSGSHANSEGHSAAPTAGPGQDTKSGNESGRRVDINKRRHRWDE